MTPDILAKIISGSSTSPSDERLKVLSLLNDYNLNAFSLFGSEEGLMEAMWFRERVLRKQNSVT
ncbi:MAG: hypothetical protein WBX38_02135 [Candidatus Sulfotelmatobacter sp.]